MCCVREKGLYTIVPLLHARTLTRPRRLYRPHPPLTGFGVDSGLPDFRGDEGFWNAYPPMRRLGLSFIDCANPQWFDREPEFAWGFYGHRLQLYRDTEPHDGFHILLDWMRLADRGRGDGNGAVRRRAQFDYTAAHPDELTFKQGDVITVLSGGQDAEDTTTEEDTTTLSALGQYLMTPATAAVTAAATAAATAAVTAAAAGGSDSGWTKGLLESNGQTGMFPTNHTVGWEETETYKTEAGAGAEVEAGSDRSGRIQREGFAFTSNVDGQLQKAGFPEDTVAECHGSIHHLQCTKGWKCDGVIAPNVSQIVVNPDTFKADLATVPSCPSGGTASCAAPYARPNILMFGDGEWCGERTDGQMRRFQAWVRSVKDRGLRAVVVEAGAGSTVPTVRMTSERLARGLDAPLIRINLRESEIPSVGAWAGEPGEPGGGAPAAWATVVDALRAGGEAGEAEQQQLMDAARQGNISLAMGSLAALKAMDVMVKDLGG